MGLIRGGKSRKGKNGYDKRNNDTATSPVNTTTDGTDRDWLAIILGIAALVIVCILLAPILPYVAHFVVWIISLPIKLISEIAKAIKKSSNNRKNE